MNVIETLKKNINVDGKIYSLSIYVTAWNKLCISYRGFDNNNKFCSVVVDADSKKVDIANAPGFFDNNIGVANTLDDAAQMIKSYVNGYEEYCEQ